MNQTFLLNRFTVMFALVILITSTIVVRLFQLQVLAHAEYEAIAQQEQQGITTYPARRGEILVEDQNGESYKLATNTTLNMIYADPTLIVEYSDPEYVAGVFAPFLFDLEVERELDEQSYEEEYEVIMSLESEVLREEALEKLSLKNEEELFEQFEDTLADTLGQQNREVILIAEALDQETQELLRANSLTGVELSLETGNLYAYPGQINDKASVASALAEVFNTDADALESILLGKNRYVELKRRLEPEVSKEIEAILEADRASAAPEFLGIRLKEEYFRYYPEQELAAQVLGYTNSAGDGQYGIEGSYNEILRGEDGIFTSNIDANGNQITVGDSIIEQAVDGADITLTIDRSIQLQVERLLAAGVSAYRADSGQAIVINPQTGDILAMAQAPTFNPNVYGEVFELVEVELTPEQEENLYIAGTAEEPIYWLYIQVDPDVRIQLFPEYEDDGELVYYAYANDVGPEVYKNKTIQEVYEPGSVFKPLVMAAGLDSGEITPNTTFVDNGPVPVDYNVLSGEYDYYIHTFNDQYHGIETMTQVLEHSCNPGMSFVAQKLGGTLLYSYLKAYGLLQRTEVGLDNEVTGNIEYYDGWTESELVTKSFGQGASMTPLQLVQAYTALANEGVMVRPKLIKKIEYPDGSVENFDTEIIRQVMSSDSADTITAMMTATMESYSHLNLENHYAAGKTGTSQSYKWGRALKGPGTTLTSFVSFAPIDDPQFLVLVKMDRPRTVEWGAATAGPVGSDIMEFLFEYYSVPPDKL